MDVNKTKRVAEMAPLMGRQKDIYWLVFIRKNRKVKRGTDILGQY